MEKLNIAGGDPLRGTVHISGAKNSAVALIPATILADSPVTIEAFRIFQILTHYEIC